MRETADSNDMNAAESIKKLNKAAKRVHICFYGKPDIMLERSRYNKPQVKYESSFQTKHKITQIVLFQPIPKLQHTYELLNLQFILDASYLG